MEQGKTNMRGSTNEPTTLVPNSDLELVVTRTFAAPAHIVFEAWTRPDLLKRWWAPNSSGVPLRSCDVDLRAGGEYRFEFGDGVSQSMTFFGHYVEVAAPSRLVWTNEESDDGAVSTLTLEEKDGGTLLVLQELYPSTDARDATLAGMAEGVCEQFEQLDSLLPSLLESEGGS